MFKLLFFLLTERDIDIGRSGVLTTRRSRDRRCFWLKWNGDRVGFDLVQFFPEDLEF